MMNVLALHTLIPKCVWVQAQHTSPLLVAPSSYDVSEDPPTFADNVNEPANNDGTSIGCRSSRYLQRVLG